MLSAIYEQDFLPCSFGGRPKLSAHHALATLNEVIAGGMISWVLEADLKNFFGSLSHDWVLRFVEHRVGDPRLISLIRRWLKAGVLEGRSGPSERTRNPARRIDQCAFEQSLPSLRCVRTSLMLPAGEIPAPERGTSHPTGNLALGPRR